MIRNIVFDMGNVLIHFDPEEFMDAEGITAPEDRKMIRQAMFATVEWSLMDMGLETEDSFEPKLRTRLPERLREKAVRMMRNWAVPRRMVPGMEALVRRLKDSGYGIYLLSNASVAQPEYWNRLPVSRYFDGTLVSAFVKTVKPTPAIYRLFTEEFHLKEEECVFIDDTPLNVAGAVACGWKGIVFYGDAAQLEEKLKELGVRF